MLNKDGPELAPVDVGGLEQPGDREPERTDAPMHVGGIAILDGVGLEQTA